jgi:putative transposase
MYEYRRMTPQQQRKAVEARRRAGQPWHAPPHFNQTGGQYFISAACYEHQSIMQTPDRRSEWENALIAGVADLDGARLDGWVVLPNHYHMLVACDLRVLAGWLGRLHNGKATQWNREDDTPGRKVWHRFSDRSIRSERHYYASLNYLHANPVKHGYVADASDWPWSSLGRYLEQLGRERLVEWWTQFPIDDYGKGWDD